MYYYNSALLSKNIDKIAQNDIESNNVFGSAYLVYNNGKTIEQCYGNTTLHGSSPVTNKTLFRLASMTKPITAFATLILVDRKVLSLDDSIDKFLPEFKNIKIQDHNKNQTVPQNIPTIRNLLSHTSGIGNDSGALLPMTDKDKLTLDSSVEYYLRNGLAFEPNTMQEYSGVGAFDVMAKIIETATKTDYLTFLKKEIFEPCKMFDTTFSPSQEQLTRIIDMHQKNNEKSATFKMADGCIFEDIPCSHYLGGAGLISSIYDYGNFAKMLLNKGKTESRQLLREEIFDLISTPQVSEKIMPGNTRWGLGVRVIVDNTYPYLPKGSFGWSGAYGSHFWINPTDNVFAVFMKNSKHDGGAGNYSAVEFEKIFFLSKND